MEITHSPQPPPKPATPILASSLLDLEKKQRTRFGGERISTGCGEVDGILGGGFERGIVVGVSSEVGEGRLLTLNTLTTLLISNLSHLPPSPPKPKTLALIIDTTGSFPLLLLSNMLRSRITSSAGGNQEKVDEKVQKCLEMVNLSRVFDVEGLWEVLGEIGHPSSNRANSQEVREDHQAQTSGNFRYEGEKQQEVEEKEVLDSDQETTPLSQLSEPSLHALEQNSRNISDPASREDGKEEGQGIEIIIIDTLTHIITELFSRKEKGDAHTLLTHLSLTIHSLTTTNNILTLLHNTTITSKPTSYSSLSYPNPLPNHPNQQQRQQQQQQPNNLQAGSIFPSNKQKPSLGMMFSQFPSLHLLLTQLPKSREDAKRLYAPATPSDNTSTHHQDSGINYCTVLEILKDETPNLDITEKEGEGGKKFGYREQRWTAVQASSDGLGLVGVFQEKGNMRGMALSCTHRGELPQLGSVESRVGLGVGNVAKIYGFGGRRV